MPIVTSPNGSTYNMTPAEAAQYKGKNGWQVDDGAGQQAAPPPPAAPGAPVYPTLNSLLDPNSGLLKSQYQLQKGADVGYESQLGNLDQRLAGINLNKEGLEALRKRGLSQGPSDWAKLMEQSQRLEEQTARGRAGEQQAGAQSSAFSELARKGGLSSGARERLAMQGQRGLTSSMQDISRQGQENRLGIGLQDEQQRLNILSQLPGMEVQALQPDFQKVSAWGQLANAEANKKSDLALQNRAYSTDVDKLNKLGAMNENARLDQSNLGAYSEAMKAYAAEQQAKATAASGSGGKK